MSLSGNLQDSREVYKVMKKNESGFSLIEILIVFVIIGILAILTFPYANKAKGAAEYNNAFATMKTMVAAQYNFYSQNSRYARLDELNTAQFGALGTVSGSPITLRRGNFTFQMSPDTPTDVQLRDHFTITATKPAMGADAPVVIQVNERGYITPVFY